MTQKQIFIACPIGAEDSEVRKRSNKLLEYIIKPVAEDLDCEVIRVDKVGTSGRITTQITRFLIQSDIVIVDLTELNPNVMYEFGLRYGSGKSFILMAKKGERLPFDIADLRTIFYEFDIEEAESSKSQLKQQVAMILEGKGSVIEEFLVERNLSPNVNQVVDNSELLKILIDSHSNLMGKIEENSELIIQLAQIILKEKEDKTAEMGVNFLTTMIQQGIQNPEGFEKIFTFMQSLQADSNNQTISPSIQDLEKIIE
jgi:nucleoside 2-deoxyribosyltransferase